MDLKRIKIIVRVKKMKEGFETNKNYYSCEKNESFLKEEKGKNN